VRAADDLLARGVDRDVPGDLRVTGHSLVE
jgi:hypothetical protein